MARFKNYYAQIIGRLSGPLKSYVDQLDVEGQIDRDVMRRPFLTKVVAEGNGTYTLYFLRNRVLVSTLFNPRSKEKVVHRSWNPNDGYRRRDFAQITADFDEPEDRSERMRRESFERLNHDRYLRMVDALLNGR